MSPQQQQQQQQQPKETETRHALLVAGSGPGIGRHTAARFAREGFQHIILLSRNAARLEEDAEFVRKEASSSSSADSNVRIDTVPVDLTDLDAVRRTLDEQVGPLLDDSKVPLQVVLHNAARVGESKLVEFPVRELESDFKISVLSMYEIARWAMPRLTRLAAEGRDGSDTGSSTSVAPAPAPAFLVTSGLLWCEPVASLFSLSACKAAQHNLVHSMAKQYEPQGVRCALVVVGGVVQDSATVTSAANVATAFWRLFAGEARDIASSTTTKEIQSPDTNQKEEHQVHQNTHQSPPSNLKWPLATTLVEPGYWEMFR